MPARVSKFAGRNRSEIDERAIVALRNKYLIEIAGLAVNGTAPLVERARELLKPRYWAKSTWRERSKILESVGWLLRTNGATREFMR
jgi:hypothetical protein